MGFCLRIYCWIMKSTPNYNLIPIGKYILLYDDLFLYVFLGMLHCGKWGGPCLLDSPTAQPMGGTSFYLLKLYFLLVSRLIKLWGSFCLCLRVCSLIIQLMSTKRSGFLLPFSKSGFPDLSCWLDGQPAALWQVATFLVPIRNTELPLAQLSFLGYISKINIWCLCLLWHLLFTRAVANRVKYSELSIFLL